MLGKIVGPRLEKLEKEFLDSGGEWKNFPICKLFRKVKTKALPYKAGDLKNKNDEIYSLPALTAGLENQGLAYYVPRGNATILKNVISVSANGANTGVMFYQPNEFTVLQDSYAIEYKDRILNSKEYLFILSALQKTIRFRFDWSNKAGWEKIKNEEITLPFLNGEIYFSYMEKYIEELEAYLVATGLKNYHLTKYDEEVLDKFNRLSETSLDRQTDRQTDKIRLGDIFNIKTPKKKYNANAVMFGGAYPYVARGESNNGIKGYITEDVSYLNDGNTISFGQDTATMFYQSEPYFTGDKIKVFEPKNFILSRHNALYCITATKKIINTFSWGATLYNVGNLENIEVEMPVQNKKLDISFMEDFIKAVEKIVIKDVVLWADKKIKATKQVVNQN